MEVTVTTQDAVQRVVAITQQTMENVIPFQEAWRVIAADPAGFEKLARAHIERRAYRVPHSDIRLIRRGHERLSNLYHHEQEALVRLMEQVFHPHGAHILVGYVQMLCDHPEFAFTPQWAGGRTADEGHAEVRARRLLQARTGGDKLFLRHYQHVVWDKSCLLVLSYLERKAQLAA